MWRKAAFWSSAALVGYTYAVFPILVLLRAVLRPMPYRIGSATPTVSILIAAHNEQANIASKIRNSLALDYPSDRLEVIVASDGSTDETVRRAKEHADAARIRVLDLPRVGKAAALEAAASNARGDVLLFTDANSAFERDALRQLVKPFADPAVGGVAGNQRYRRGHGADGVAEGERAYWNFDRVLKIAESSAGSTVSATGAIYAVRRSAFRGVPSGVTDDFAVSTAVIAQGYRLVFAADAVAWEPVATSSGTEWDRKVRIITRGLRGVYERRELLDPRRFGFYSVQLFSHKVLRRLMGVPMIVIAAVTPGLWSCGSIYRAALVGQAAVYGLGALGLVFGGHPAARSKVVAAPAFFLLVNAAALRAAWNVVRGRKIERWNPERDQAVS